MCAFGWTNSLLLLVNYAQSARARERERGKERVLSVYLHAEKFFSFLFSFELGGFIWSINILKKIFFNIAHTHIHTHRSSHSCLLQLYWRIRIALHKTLTYIHQRPCASSVSYTFHSNFFFHLIFERNSCSTPAFVGLGSVSFLFILI